MAANPDRRCGKHIYRPELVNIAWVHEAANTAADNGGLHPSGKVYRSAHINDYRGGTAHETYFVHFARFLSPSLSRYLVPAGRASIL